MNHQTIIVLDFGSQYTQLIARRLRELSVYSEIWPPETPAEKIRARKPAGIILSGGPKSVSDAGAPQCDPALFELLWDTYVYDPHGVDEPHGKLRELFETDPKAFDDLWRSYAENPDTIPSMVIGDVG